MSIPAVPSRPTSSFAAPRWRIVAAALALIGVIAAVIVLAASRTVPGPGPTGARPASVHSGYFHDPGPHALLSRTARAIPFHEAGGAVSHARP
jgi:hypothetical protein